MNSSLSNPSLSNKAIRRRSLTPDVSNYQEFLDFLYDDIDFVINRLSRHRDKYSEGMRNNPKQGEDLINSTICDILAGRGWEAEHDTHVNGNADIVVSIKYEPYEWIGEAKIRSGNTNLEKGMKQLLHRYSTGRSFQNFGGLVVYVNDTSTNLKKIFEAWQEFILLPSKDSYDDDGYLLPALSPVKEIKNCTENQLLFYSTHEHPSTGIDYTIRHMIIDFRHTPIE